MAATTIGVQGSADILDGLTGRGVTIGHIDTGVDADHPCLADRIADFLHVDRAGSPRVGRHPVDTGGHGTQTAGVICGGLHGTDSIGVAPQARLVSVAALEGGEVVWRILTGLSWIIERRPRIVCLPFGLPPDNPVLRPALVALRLAGTLVVAPIGNGGAGAATSPGVDGLVLSVGASDQDNRVARFSGSLNPGPGLRCHKPDITAPGTEVKTTLAGADVGLRTGTSLAAAYIAGVAALLVEAAPQASADELAAALTETASPIAGDQTHRSRAGLVRPGRALAWLREGGTSRVELSGTSDRQVAYRDPRLLRTLDTAAAESSVVAIVTSDHGVQELAAAIDLITANMGHGPHRLSQLPLVAAARVQAPHRFIGALLEHPSITVACAPDVDRGLDFGS